MAQETETETLLIKAVEERTGRVSGNTFWAVTTDKGEYTCHEPLVFDALAKNQGNVCKIETLRTEKYNNIKRLIEVVEVKEAKEAPASSGVVKQNASHLSQLVSYAKDLVCEGKAKSMEEAINEIVKAYKIVSKEI